MTDFVLLGSERYVRIEVAAQWYRTEVSFIDEAATLGLLELDQSRHDSTLLPEHELDRLAQLLRWHWQTGLELTVIASLLSPRPS